RRASREPRRIERLLRARLLVQLLEAEDEALVGLGLVAGGAGGLGDLGFWLVVDGGHAVVPVCGAQGVGDGPAPARARFHAGVALDLVGGPGAVLAGDRAAGVGLGRRVDDDDHAAVGHLLAGLDRGEADGVDVGLADDLLVGVVGGEVEREALREVLGERHVRLLDRGDRLGDGVVAADGLLAPERREVVDVGVAELAGDGVHDRLLAVAGLEPFELAGDVAFALAGEVRRVAGGAGRRGVAGLAGERLFLARVGVAAGARDV